MAGLYQEKESQLYAIRGVGYLGYAGRVGIKQIIILSLHKQFFKKIDTDFLAKS